MTPRPLTQLQPIIRAASDRGEWDTVFALCEELELSGDDASMAVALRQRGYYAILQSRYDEALSILRRAEEYARSADLTAELAAILNNQGMAYVWNGDPDAAEVLINKARDIYVALGDRRGEARALHNLGLVCERRADWVKGYEIFSETLAICEELGDQMGIMTSVSCVAHMSASLGRHSESLEQYTRAYAISIQENVPAGSARYLSGMSTIHAYMGDHETALRLIYQALDVNDAHPEPRLSASLHESVAMAFARMGDYALAIEYMKRSLEIALSINFERMIGYCLSNLGELYSRSGLVDDAMRSYEQAIEWCRAQNVRDGLVLSLANTARMKINEGDLSGAQALIDEARVALSQGQLEKPYVALAQAFVYFHEGRHEDAERELDLIGDVHDVEAEQRMGIYRLRRDIAFMRKDFETYVMWNERFTELHERTHGGDTQRKMTALVTSRQMEQERRDHQRHLELLHTMLPSNIATRVIAGEKVIGDRFEHAAVLFADIVGFTEHTSRMEPEDVVRMLDSIYNSFDAACIQHGVTKIKTMGDSYICFSGEGAMGSNVEAVLSVAHAMLGTEATWPNGEHVQLRIGVHAGPVAAGVIGTQRLQYDIWGDTVNLASRLESSGMPGRVHVSEDVVHALSADAWAVEARGDVDVKGKGTLRTFWLMPGK